MRLFERTLIVETLSTSGVVALVAIGIYVIGKIAALLRRAVSGNVPSDDLFTLLGLKLISFVDVILAPVLFVAILLVLIRWNRDREITVYATSGVGPFHFVISLSLIIAGAFSLIAPLTLFLAPAAERTYEGMLQEFKNDSKHVLFEQGEFVSSNDGRRVVFFGATDSDQPDEFRLFHLESHDDGQDIVTIARSGQIVTDAVAGNRILSLDDGVQYIADSGKSDYETMDFRSLRMNLDPYSAVQIRINPAGKSFGELWKSQNVDDAAEFWWRISKLIMIPIIACAAFVMGSVPLGNGIGINMLSAIGSYFMYSSLIGFAIQQIRNQTEYAYVMLMLIHGLAFTLTVLIIIRFLENRKPLPSIFHSRL